MRRPAPPSPSRLAAACAAALLLGAALVGCGGRAAPRADAPDSARAAAHLEAGNAAFAAGDWARAARRYGAATVAAPDNPAAWYGLGMALARLGRDEEARAAYRRSKELAAAARAR
uniref:Tetratricopeptide repeat protein n=1 Tax=Eiseniibacteriota bacterium TaxID=2212470 RepID=A0A832I327_UNCEI